MGAQGHCLNTCPCASVHKAIVNRWPLCLGAHCQHFNNVCDCERERASGYAHLHANAGKRAMRSTARREGELYHRVVLCTGFWPLDHRDKLLGESFENAIAVASSMAHNPVPSRTCTLRDDNRYGEHVGNAAIPQPLSSSMVERRATMSQVHTCDSHRPFACSGTFPLLHCLKRMLRLMTS